MKPRQKRLMKGETVGTGCGPTVAKEGGKAKVHSRQGGSLRHQASKSNATVTNYVTSTTSSTVTSTVPSTVTSSKTSTVLSTVQSTATSGKTSTVTSYAHTHSCVDFTRTQIVSLINLRSLKGVLN